MMTTRGISLSKDLKILLNNPTYSDLKILCEDDVIVHGNKAILAARCEVLDKLLFNGMKETNQNQIKFPVIKSTSMLIVMEYLYTGVLNNDELEFKLDKDNVVGTYHAADYFQLVELQGYIISFIRSLLKNKCNPNANNANTNSDNSNVENIAPELLTDAVEKMSYRTDNELIKLLTSCVSKIALDTLEYDKLSIEALKCLLRQTLNTKELFVTPEYSIFRYIVIRITNDVSKDLVRLIEKWLPEYTKIRKDEDSNKITIINDDNGDGGVEMVRDCSITDEEYCVVGEKKRVEECSSSSSSSSSSNNNEKNGNREEDKNKYEENRHLIIESLSPILEYIDLRRINVNILVDIIEPLNLIPLPTLLDVYRFQAKERRSLSPIRRAPLTKWDIHWDKQHMGNNLVIVKGSGNSVVESSKTGISVHNNVRANFLICGKGIFEWEVVIEEVCIYAWVGIATEKGLDFSIFAGQQSCAWVLGSSGKCYHNNVRTNYTSEFGAGTRVTVHLDMTNRTCAFSINGVRHPNVANWINIPSTIYPIASINQPGRLRMGPYLTHRTI